VKKIKPTATTIIMVNIFLSGYTYIYFYALHNIGTPISLPWVITHWLTCLHRSRIKNNMAAVL